MEFYLLTTGIIIILIGYSIIMIDYLKYKRQEHKKINGFDIAKKITANYDNINIVESSEIWISKYHLKRKVIRLTNRIYSGTDEYSLAIATYLSSLSLSDNKYLNIISKIIPTIDFLNKSSLIMIISSYFMNTKGDAKIGIIIGVIILIYQYLYLQICSDTIATAQKKEPKKEKIIKIINHLYTSNTLFFISTLIFLLRFIIILKK